MTPSRRCATWGRTAATELVAALEELRALALPVACGGCGGPLGWGALLCRGCGEGCASPPGPVCVRCGEGWRGGGACGRCARFGREFAFARARALWLYRGVVQDLVQAFKYRGARHLLEPLGRRLARGPLVGALVEPRVRPLVVGVPARAASRRQRGYDQARELALGFADERGWPLAPGRALTRRRQPGTGQAGRSGPGRRRRVRAGFRAEPALVAGRPVLLVDDVLGTGATADAAARALALAGSGPVAVLTLAS